MIKFGLDFHGVNYYKPCFVKSGCFETSYVHLENSFECVHVNEWVNDRV